MSKSAKNEAWITLATNDTYAVGALVLGSSLHCVNTNRKLCIMIAPDVSRSMKRILGNVFDEVVVVDVLDSKDAAHLALMSRPELGITFTKIHCWSRTRYSKAVFLDADTLVIKNCDELFDYDELSAVTDIGWPDLFNSGVFVFRPSNSTFQALLKMAIDRGSFDGGDQGLLNQYFHKWNRLSFIYNMVSAISYTYLPAYKQFGKDTKIVHFLGARKPWEAEGAENDGSMPRSISNSQGCLGGVEHLLWWWTLFLQNIQPQLYGDDLRGFAARFATKVLNDIVARHAHALLPAPKPDGFDSIQRKITDSIRRSAQRAKDALVPVASSAAPSKKPPEKPASSFSIRKKHTEKPSPAGPPSTQPDTKSDQRPLLPDEAEKAIAQNGLEMTKRKQKKWCCCGGSRQGT